MLHPQGPAEFRIDFGAECVGPLVLKQRGLAAMINATAATTTARLVLGEAFRPDVTDEALRAVTPPFGRGEVIDAGGYALELVRVKNPAGFTVALGTYHAEPVTTMVAINDDYADGQDVSWLYDVWFESLRENGVALTSGVAPTTWPWSRLRRRGGRRRRARPQACPGPAIRDFPAEPRRIFCTYTAMMRLRRLLAARYGLAGFGEETE